MRRRAECGGVAQSWCAPQGRGLNRLWVRGRRHLRPQQASVLGTPCSREAGRPGCQPPSPGVRVTVAPPSPPQGALVSRPQLGSRGHPIGPGLAAGGGRGRARPSSVLASPCGLGGPRFRTQGVAPAAGRRPGSSAFPPDVPPGSKRTLRGTPGAAHSEWPRRFLVVNPGLVFTEPDGVRRAATVDTVGLEARGVSSGFCTS